MKNIHSAMLPIIIVSLLFGVSQISINKLQNCSYSTRLMFGKILPLVYLLTYTYAISYLLQFEHHTSDVYKIALSDTVIYDYLGSIATAYTILCFNLTDGNRIKKSVTKICKIDMIFEHMGIEVHYNRLFYYQILQTIIGFIFMLVLIIKQHKRSIENDLADVIPDVIFAKEFILSLPLVLIFLMESQIAIYGLILYQRFCYVNTTLRNMTKLKHDLMDINVVKVMSVVGK